MMLHTKLTHGTARTEIDPPTGPNVREVAAAWKGTASEFRTSPEEMLALLDVPVPVAAELTAAA